MKVQLKFDWLQRAHNLGLSYRTILILILLSLVATATEIFGMGIFLPIFQFIELKGDIDALVSDSILWQYIVNWFTFTGIEPSLIVLLAVSFSFFLCRQIFTYLRLIYTAAVKQSITQIQRNKMFDRYVGANTSYHDSVPVGNLVNVMTTEVSAAITGIMSPVELISYIIMFVAYLGVLSFLSWQMTLLSIVVLLLTSIIPSRWIKKSAYTGRSLVGANTLMSEFLVGRLRSPRLVRLAGTEVAEKNEFYQLTHRQRKYSVFSAILQARTDVVMEPIVIGFSLIFIYFSYAIFQLQIEIIGLYIVIILRLLPTLKGIVARWQTVQRSLGSIEIIEDRLKAMLDSAEQDTGTELLNHLECSIIMSNISYRYPTGENDALKNITIEFKVGEMTAIVGPSGSGKSTLIDLLPRLRIPTKGLVQIDASDIKKYKLKSLREIISYVPQFPQIFDGTVKKHILYGKEDATNQEILEAVRLSGAEDFINQLPQGFNTILGEDAIRLSGGQRQRLDLARALVRKSQILILDEPTSNLDAETEELFKQALNRIRKETNTIIIIVAHRLKSIAEADNIVVLNQGKIVEHGTHLKLLDQDGWYAKAWKMQG
jgi:ABC-type multidrug transport system fused ATPase/permease subunit